MQPSSGASPSALNRSPPVGDFAAALVFRASVLNRASGRAARG